MSLKTMSEEDLFRILEDPNFKTDHCSGGLSKLWKKLFKKECPYNYYCMLHDAYWYWILHDSPQCVLDSAILKKKSDIQLFKDIWNNDRYWYDKPMAVGVSIVLTLIGSPVFAVKLLKK